VSLVTSRSADTFNDYGRLGSKESSLIPHRAYRSRRRRVRRSGQRPWPARPPPPEPPRRREVEVARDGATVGRSSKAGATTPAECSPTGERPAPRSTWTSTRSSGSTSSRRSPAVPGPAPGPGGVVDGLGSTKCSPPRSVRGVAHASAARHPRAHVARRQHYAFTMNDGAPHHPHTVRNHSGAAANNR